MVEVTAVVIVVVVVAVCILISVVSVVVAVVSPDSDYRLSSPPCPVMCCSVLIVCFSHSLMCCPVLYMLQ